MKRIAIAAVLWIAALYLAQAGAVAFSGEVASGGERKGYAQDISCARNWWAFGLLWSCEATIVADDGKRYPYSSDNSGLTPADIGRQVPMTTNRVGSGVTRGSTKWGLAERRDPAKVPRVLCLVGPPLIAFIITFRMFRREKSTT